MKTKISFVLGGVCLAFAEEAEIRNLVSGSWFRRMKMLGQTISVRAKKKIPFLIVPVLLIAVVRISKGELLGN